MASLGAVVIPEGLPTARELAELLGFSASTIVDWAEDETYGHMLPDALDRALGTGCIRSHKGRSDR